MSDQDDPDARRRALLASVLAGGATYALPMVASLGGIRPASAQEESRPGTGRGRPAEPGRQGNGDPQRPAEPGEGGLGRNTGNNPHHGSGAEESQEPGGGGGGAEESQEPGGGGGGPEESQEPGGGGGGAEESQEPGGGGGAGSSEAVSTGHVDGIGPGGRGFG